MANQEQRNYLQKKIKAYRTLTDNLLQKDINELGEKDFGFLVAEGGKLCVDILGYILEERGYRVVYETGVVINAFKADTKTKTRNDEIDIFDFCISVKGILPEECVSFIKLIKKYRNRTIHAKNADIHELIVDFTGAMQNFLGWFDNQTGGVLQIKKLISGLGIVATVLPSLASVGAAFALGPFGVLLPLAGVVAAGTVAAAGAAAAGGTSATGISASETEDDDSVEMEKAHLYSEENSQNRDLYKPKSLNETNNKSINNVNKAVTNESNDSNNLEYMVGMEKRLQESLQAFQERMQERLQTIEEGVNENNRLIKTLSEEINLYQQMVEKQLKKATTDEEIEHLLSSYTDECVERIVNIVKSRSAEKLLQEEKEKLIQLIGESSWQKLDEDSKTDLITAKLEFKYKQELGEEVDYSSVCISVCKALEVELTKRFYKDFLNYLRDKYGNDYSKYHTSLLYDKNQVLTPEGFSMGRVRYTLCYTKDKRKFYPKQTENNKQVLLEYTQKCLLSRYTSDEIEVMLRDYAKAIEHIKNKYRNPSAHKGRVQKTHAKDCLALVIDVEKLLKKMLDSFDN